MPFVPLDPKDSWVRSPCHHPEHNPPNMMGGLQTGKVDMPRLRGDYYPDAVANPLRIGEEMDEFRDRGTPGPTRGEGMGNRGGYVRTTARDRRQEESERLRQLQEGSAAHKEATERQVQNQLLRSATIADLLGFRQEVTSIRNQDQKAIARLADRVEAIYLALSNLTFPPSGSDGSDDVELVREAFSTAFQASSKVIADWRAEAEGIAEIPDHAGVLERLRQWNSDPNHPPLRAACFPARWVQSVIDAEESSERMEILLELGFHLRQPEVVEPEPDGLTEG